VTQPSFGVDAIPLEIIARNVDVIGDYIDDVEKSLRAHPPLGEEDFAEYGLVGAYRQFFDAWTAELHTAAGAAHQLGALIQQAAGSYHGSDAQATQRFGPR
jgi:hypothetical protein